MCLNVRNEPHVSIELLMIKCSYYIQLLLSMSTINLRGGVYGDYEEAVSASFASCSTMSVWRFPEVKHGRTLWLARYTSKPRSACWTIIAALDSVVTISTRGLTRWWVAVRQSTSLTGCKLPILRRDRGVYRKYNCADCVFWRLILASLANL